MTHSPRYQIHPFSSILRGWRERRHGSQHRLGGSAALTPIKKGQPCARDIVAVSNRSKALYLTVSYKRPAN